MNFLSYFFVFFTFSFSSLCLAGGENRWKSPERLDYPEEISVPKASGRRTDFPEYTGGNLCLSSHNLPYLVASPLKFRDPDEVVLNESSATSHFSFKEHIDVVSMSEMKILGPEDSKTALMTLHVFPCVAITAFNKANKRMGMAHIPGTDRDRLLNFDKNPLTEPSTETHLKVDKSVIEIGLRNFLSNIKLEQKEEDVKIKIFGGSNNRELLLIITDIIAELGYPIHVQHIHWGNYNDRRNKPSINHMAVFDILMEKNGKVFVLKKKVGEIADALGAAEVTQPEEILNPFHTISAEMNKRWVERTIRQWKSQDADLNDKYLESIKEPREHQKKYDQFKRLYLTIGQEETVFQ